VSAELDSRFRAEELIDFASAVLEHLEVPERDARAVAECLVLADLRGVDSHGLLRLRVYARRVQAKVVNAHPAIEVSYPFPAVALVDGDNGLGPVVGARAMDTAIELAGRAGIGFVGVRHSNHFGVGAYYVDKAVKAGLIGCAISNAPPNMAPFGGKERFLGTNPLAIGIPGGEHGMIFDAATSVVARGKIIAAAKRNQAIPEGWALDPDGRPTTDAQQGLAGAVLPFGGAKGSAISFLIDILCGVLTGASFALHLNTLEDLTSVQNVGHVLVAIRPDLFLSEEAFSGRVNAIFGMLAASPPAAGVARVLLPGEVEMQAETRNRQHGICLAGEVADELAALGAELGVDFPRAVNPPFSPARQAQTI
jgi:LDH2 family malate/lactate/ureidoglycolate dehydrogenase